MTKKIKRIIVCQGVTNLIAAFSGMKHRESLKKENYEYENYLIIHNLSAPAEQKIKISEFIEKMAKVLGDWKSIIYLDERKSKKLLKKGKLKSKINTIQNIIKTKKVNEIYLLRNKETENKLLMHAYHSAEKISYGDGFGLYHAGGCFTNKSFKIFLKREVNETKGIKRLFIFTKNELRKIKYIYDISRKKAQNDKEKKIFVKGCGFDSGCFQSQKWLTTAPLMKTTITPQKITTDILKKLQVLLNKKDIQSLKKKISNKPAIVMLLSSFSENEVISMEKEILAYKEFLKSQNFPKNSILIIKSHPRNNPLKIEKLKQSLKGLYKNIIILTQKDLFFTPFEIFFMKIFLDKDLKPLKNFNVVSFSTAALPLALLFKIKPILGFGEKIVTRFFGNKETKFRLGHEKYMQQNLEKLLSN